MGDDRHPPSEYRWARQVSAVLLIAVVVPLLLTAAGLLSVDLPRVRP